MDAVGLVAAVPELFKLAKCTLVKSRQIASKRRIGNAIKGVETQLGVLDGFISHVQLRQEPYLSSLENAEHLDKLILEIQDDLQSARDLIEKVQIASQSSLKVLSRAKLVLTSFEKRIREYREQLEKQERFLQDYLQRLREQYEDGIKSEESRIDTLKQVENLLRPVERSLDTRLPGTFEWIHSHPIFTAWLAKPEGSSTSTTSNRSEETSSVGLRERILIVHGVIGCGKSVLAAFIVECLKKTNNTLFFSFSADHKQEQQIATMFRTILWQLIQFLPNDRQNDYVSTLLKKPNVNNLDFLLTEVNSLSNYVESDMYCVIDGIDESMESWNNLREGPLVSVVRMLEANSRLRVLLVGRGPSLQAALRNWPLHIELTGGLIRDDISLFIASELQSCESINDETTRHFILRELEEKEAIMFLWIKYIFKELREADSLAEIRQALQRPVDDLDMHYRRMLSVITDKSRSRIMRERAKGLLSLIVGAARKMTLTELIDAYAYSILPSSPTSRFEDNRVSKDGVLQACGGFITLAEGDVICLVHTSVRDFLFRPVSAWTKEDAHISFFRLEPEECQQTLALSCLRYMVHQVDWPSTQSGQNSDSFIAKHTFLEYASSYLPSHLMASSFTIAEARNYILGHISSDKFFSWIDLMLLREGLETSYPQPPFEFWDDVFHCWGAFFSEDAEPYMLLQFMGRLKAKAIQPSEESSKATRPSLLAIDHFLAQTEIESFNDSEEDCEDQVKQQPSSELSVFQSKQTGKALQGHARVLNFSQIVKSSPDILTMVRSRVKFNNPFDLMLQSLENSFDQMSFLALMALGTFAYRTMHREQSTLEIFQAALTKVQGKDPFREAWARIWVAHSYTDYHDEKIVHYRKAMELLEDKMGNPLLDHMWQVAASDLMRSLFFFDQKDEALRIANALEKRLVDKKSRSVDNGLLRDSCYRAIKGTAMYQKEVLSIAASVAKTFETEDLPQNIERILLPFANGTAVVNKSTHQKVSELLGLWREAMESMGRTDEALNVLHEGRKAVQSHIGEGPMFTNGFRLQLARVYYNVGSFTSAKKEILKIDMHDWLSQCSYDDAVGFIDTYLGIFTSLNQTRKIFHMLDGNLPLVLTALTIETDDRFSNLVGLLLSYGIFSETATFLEKILSKDLSLKTLERLTLFEALAFSIRSQAPIENPEAPCEYYQKCIQLSKAHFDDPNPFRILIGLATAYVLARKHQEAAKIFRQLAHYGSQVSSYYVLYFLALENQQLGTHEAAMQLLAELVWSILDDWLPDEDEERSTKRSFYESELIRTAGYLPVAEVSQLYQNGDENSETFESDCEQNEEDPQVDQVKWSMESIYDECGVIGDREEKILFVSAHLMITDIVQLRGDIENTLKHMKRALKVLQALFAPDSLSKFSKFDCWMSRWAQSCERYLLERIEGNSGDVKPWDMFPFEIWWAEDHGYDVFKGSF